MRVWLNNFVKSHKTTNYGDKSLTMLGPKVWINSPKILNQNLVLVYLRNILILGSDSDTNATLHFDIIYENGGQNGENNYRVDPFQKMQVDEMKCRFTKMISSLVVLTVLPSRLNIFKAFILYFVCFYLALIPFYTVRSVHFCKRLTFFPKINKDFIHS